MGKHVKKTGAAQRGKGEFCLGEGEQAKAKEKAIFSRGGNYVKGVSIRMIDHTLLVARKLNLGYYLGGKKAFRTLGKKIPKPISLIPVFSKPARLSCQRKTVPGVFSFMTTPPPLTCPTTRTPLFRSDRIFLVSICPTAASHSLPAIYEHDCGQNIRGVSEHQCLSIKRGM